MNEQLIPDDSAERRTYAMRLIAERCLYGVDKNPLAVEMAKLSLWLLTLAKDKPFTFVDHAIRCGDSLVGISSVDQLLRFSLSDDVTTGPLLEQQRQQIENRLNAVKLLRRQIEDQPSNTPQDVERKGAMLRQADEQTRRLTYAADLLLAASWQPLTAAERANALNSTLVEVEYKFKDLPVAQLDAEAKGQLREAGIGERFHWPLEFPEVFGRGGFDGFVCNPPFMGGLRLETAFGTRWRAYIVHWLANDVRGVRGTADLCAYFALRAGQLVRLSGVFGFLATNTIAQGDTRVVGLDQLTSNDFRIVRAVASQKWPGSASLEVAVIWVRRGDWHGDYYLDHFKSTQIGPYLSHSAALIGKPHALVQNAGIAFQGSIILGKGLVLSADEGQRLRSSHARNCDIVLPYMNGDDLNSRWDQSPSRYVINFFGWPLCRDSANGGYRGPVAEDYQDCLAIVEQRAKPERMQYKPINAWNRKVRNYWWQFGQYRWALDSALQGRTHVLVSCRVTKYLSHSKVPIGPVFDVALNVIVDSGDRMAGCLENSLYESWVRSQGSTLETRLRYTLNDCFETFPFPTVKAATSNSLEHSGRQLHELRRLAMQQSQIGITDLLNAFNTEADSSELLCRMRDALIQLDRAMAAAYGWDDLDLGHGFHETRQGVRFTLSDPARREVLQRLLALNHERYAEEVRQGLHAKKKGEGKGKKAGKMATRREKSLFDSDPMS